MTGFTYKFGSHVLKVINCEISEGVKLTPAIDSNCDLIVRNCIFESDAVIGSSMENIKVSKDGVVFISSSQSSRVFRINHIRIEGELNSLKLEKSFVEIDGGGVYIQGNSYGIKASNSAIKIRSRSTMTIKALDYGIVAEDSNINLNCLNKRFTISSIEGSAIDCKSGSDLQIDSLNCFTLKSRGQHAIVNHGKSYIVSKAKTFIKVSENGFDLYGKSNIYINPDDATFTSDDSDSTITFYPGGDIDDALIIIAGRYYLKGGFKAVSDGNDEHDVTIFMVQ